MLKKTFVLSEHAFLAADAVIRLFFTEPSFLMPVLQCWRPENYLFIQLESYWILAESGPNNTKRHE
jgi:hypothetical protein